MPTAINVTPESMSEETTPINGTLQDQFSTGPQTKERAMYALTHSYAESELGLYWERVSGMKLDWTDEIVPQITANSSVLSSDPDIYWIGKMANCLPQIIKLLADNDLMSNQTCMYMTLQILKRLLTWTPLTSVEAIPEDAADAYGWESLTQYGDEENLQCQRCSRIFYNQNTKEYYDVELGKYHVLEYDVNFSGSPLLTPEAITIFGRALARFAPLLHAALCKSKTITMPYYPPLPDDEAMFTSLTVNDLAMASTMNRAAELIMGGKTRDAYMPEIDGTVFDVESVEPEIYYIQKYNRFIIVLNLYNGIGQQCRVHFAPDEQLYIPDDADFNEHMMKAEACARNLRKTLEEVILPFFFEPKNALSRNLWVVELEDYNYWLLPFQLAAADANAYGTNLFILNSFCRHVRITDATKIINMPIISVITDEIAASYGPGSIIGNYIDLWTEEAATRSAHNVPAEITSRAPDAAAETATKDASK